MGEQCQSCQYPADTLKEYPGKPLPREGDPETLTFCDICANTFLSSFVTYSTLYAMEFQHLAGAIGYIGNMLRDEIRNINNPR